MKIVIARNAGFCDGVGQATRIALAAAAGPGGVWSDGPLVHNEQAVRLLALHGVTVSDAPRPGDTKALIRAHGIGPERRLALLEQGLELVDATCGHVARNQRLAARAAEKGETVVIAGDPGHPEVRAVRGYGGAACRVVSDLSQVQALAAEGPVLFLAQTTFDVSLFRKMAEAMRGRFPGCRVVDTICRATRRRQRETARIARRADALVVVGGRDSANTRRLADVGRARGKPVFQVETAAELREADFAGFGTVAVTAGASTPGWVTQEVVDRLRFMGRPSPAARAFRLLHTLVESRVLTAASAGGLALAAERFVAGSLFPTLALAAACFVLYAHILNRRIPADREALRLSHVDSFYRARRRPMLVLAWLSAALALVLAAGWGGGPLLLFALAVAGAGVYARVRKTPAGRLRPRWLRAAVCPGQGALARAFAWSLVLAGPPALLAGEYGKGSGAGLFVLLLCLGGTLIRDLHDTASDRLVGIATPAARLGPARTRQAAQAILGLAAALPVCAAASALADIDAPASRFLFLLAMPLVPGVGLRILERVENGRLTDAVLLQAAVDGMGCLAGLVAVIAGAVA